MINTQILSEVTLSDQAQECEREIERLGQKAQGFTEQIAQEPNPNVCWALISVKQTCHSEVGRLKRVLAALKAGYERIPLNEREGWIKGYVEDPRPYKHPTRLALIFSLLFWPATTLLSYWVLDQVAPPKNVETELISSILLGLMATLLSWRLIALNTDARNQDSLWAAGISPWGNLFFFKGKVPAKVMTAYQQALSSGLFEEVMILAPKEAFRRVRVQIDPIIFGIVGGETFLVAQFDLGKDLSISLKGD